MTAACPEDSMTNLLQSLLARLNQMDQSVVARLDQIEHRLELNIEKEAYTVDETAERVGRRPWTVRDWCNKGQVPNAYKVNGKGRTGEWRIPHDSVARLQADGPLPLDLAAK